MNTDAIAPDDDSPGYCGTNCPLNGGDPAHNPCPWNDHCAAWRDELAFERLEQRERAERRAKEGER